MFYPPERAYCVTVPVSSPEAEGTPASWLAASITQMRIFACSLLMSASARVARK